MSTEPVEAGANERVPRRPAPHERAVKVNLCGATHPPADSTEIRWNEVAAQLRAEDAPCASRASHD